MLSSDGRFALVYNGELYNFQELRADLEAHGHIFRGNSDSEVLLEACAAWGIKQTVRRCLGMFAFGLWDRQEHCLTLVRDRIGIKPLYWARFGQVFLFGSELKALRAHPCFETQLDRNMVIPFLRYNYIPAPHSIYRDVYKLEPGCILQVRSQHEPHITRYWDLNHVVEQGADAPLQVDIGQTRDQLKKLALDQLETLLSDAVQRRMVADVPLGAFLSGGIDSSTIVALMQQHSSRPIKTFTIGFQEAARDESPHAQQIARHLGTDHQTLVVEPSHAVDLLPRIPIWYDEPFADTSQVPTCFVSYLARQEVTVALSGDGGDELFAGYKRYLKAAQLWSRFSQVPPPLRAALAQATGLLPPFLENVQSLAPKPLSRLVKHTHQLTRALLLNTADLHDRQLWRRWEDPASLVIDADANGAHKSYLTHHTTPSLDIVSQMQFLDTLSYLPDNNLTKVDRASMGVSLEVRVPLLDHRIVEFTWTLPAHMKIHNGQGKWLLRQLLYKYVPRELVERPKQGFGVPLSAWLRGPLREWAEDLLSERALCQTGVFKPALVRRKWTEHIAGTSDSKRQLWNVLMFQAWHNQWM
jgi:asparagine synthase (glutamine-hydrolysing)